MPRQKVQPQLLNCHIKTPEKSSSVVLNGGSFTPEGIWSQWWQGSKLPDLLNMQTYAGQPLTTWDYPAQNVNSAKTEKPWSKFLNGSIYATHLWCGKCVGLKGPTEWVHTPGSATLKPCDILTKPQPVTKLGSLVCKMGLLPPPQEGKAAEGLSVSTGRGPPVNPRGQAGLRSPPSMTDKGSPKYHIVSK